MKNGFKKILIFIVIVCGAWYVINYKNLNLKDIKIKEEINDLDNKIKSNELYSSNAILISLDDDKILLDKSEDEKIYPASLTKIMTAIVAIENLNDLNKKIYLSEKMFNELSSEGASMAGFLPNERVEAIDLIYGVLLPSGAESCIGLAEAISGSEKKYVKLMNEKARVLDMNNTNFTNSTGLHNRNHYSTVSDIAKLLEYALQNDIFREIYTSKSHATKATNLHPEGIIFESTMFKKINVEYLENGRIEGGKTGYTEEAKLCLASLANIDGKEYILVTANAEGGPETNQYNILDAFNIYNQISRKDI
ncbi:D-alanyl-D-alanine carboxypeptidase [Clostridium sp. CTA-7]